MFTKKKFIHEYTIEICNSCSTEKKRRFNVGDFLFAETSKCASCDGMMLIEKIFAEITEH